MKSQAKQKKTTVNALQQHLVAINLANKRFYTAVFWWILKFISISIGNIYSTHSRTSPKNFGGAMKFCPNFVTFAQIMIL